MDPAEREKAGYKSRHTVGVKPPPNPAATVFVHNVSSFLVYFSVFTFDQLCCYGCIAGLLCHMAEAEGCAQSRWKDCQC